MLLLSSALNCTWLVEQPEGSKDVFWRHPRLDWVSNVVTWESRLIYYNHTSNLRSGEAAFG